MPEDYKKVILKEYKRRKDEGDLPPNLLDPTPGSVRDECLIVCSERSSPKDDEILRLFFRDGDKEKGYLKNIQNSKAAKFKQLPKILNHEVPNPADRFIELIAWLIDFQPRPSISYYKSFYDPPVIKSVLVAPDKGEDTATLPIPEEGGNKPTPNDPNPPILPPPEGTNWLKKMWSNLNLKKSVWTLLTVVAVGGGTYLVSKNINQKCMYWTGEQYQEISCNEKVGDLPVIAIDTQKVAHLKRITRPDTLTRQSIGRVWYVKIKVDSVEFYTAPGDYPLDNNKRLLPATYYMLNKYAFSKYGSKN